MLEINGLESLVNDLERIERLAPERVADGAGEVAERAFRDAQTRVPVRTGHLKSTGRIVRFRAPNIRGVRIVYDADYAATVHETIRERPNGESKWLANSMTAADLAPIDASFDSVF